MLKRVRNLLNSNFCCCPELRQNKKAHNSFCFCFPKCLSVIRKCLNIAPVKTLILLKNSNLSKVNKIFPLQLRAEEEINWFLMASQIEAINGISSSSFNLSFFFVFLQIVIASEYFQII